MKILSNMRKILFLITFIMAVSVQAQYVGVKAGFNYANLKGETLNDAKIRNGHGFYAGVTLDVPLSKLFSIQAEGVFSRMSSKIESPIGSATLTLDYLSVPALAKVNVYKGFSIYVGPQLNFLLNNHDFKFVKSESVVVVEDRAIDKFDLSAIAGISYKTKSNYVFELRIAKGLTNILESSNKSLIDTKFSGNYDFKTQIISAGIGYIF